VGKPELGTKYTCAECGTKFYDLGRPDPVCPSCGTVPEPPKKPAPRRGRKSKNVLPPKSPVVDGDDDDDDDDVAGADDEELDLDLSDDDDDDAAGVVGDDADDEDF
jgi:hypothetical protein